MVKVKKAKSKQNFVCKHGKYINKQIESRLLKNNFSIITTKRGTYSRLRTNLRGKRKRH